MRAPIEQFRAICAHEGREFAPAWREDPAYWREEPPEDEEAQQHEEFLTGLPEAWPDA